MLNQADPDLHRLESKASVRGYRRPTLSEILYLAPEDLYAWCGILWVKFKDGESQHEVRGASQMRLFEA